MPSRILYINDGGPTGMLLERILTRERGDVVRCVRYHDGILSDTVQDNPDLVIIDFTIRDVDVLDLCQCLRADPALQHIPILLFQVSVPARVRQNVEHIGIQGYLPYVWRPQEFLAARDAVLGGETYYPLKRQAR